MARSREQGRKPKAKKEGGKSKKAKAREVKRNLKQLMISNKTKTEDANKEFDTLRHEIIADAKDKKNKSEPQAQITSSEIKPQVSMEDTTSEFQKLGSEKT